MKRVLFLIFFLHVAIFAQKLEISDFQTDVYSKSGKVALKKVNLSMIVIGRYVEDESYKIIDALNVVIGSYFAEDLFTSKGKESLKKGLISYTSKKYSIDIDDVYIQKFYMVKFPKVDKIVEALRKEGCCGVGYEPPNRHLKSVPNRLPNLQNKDDDTIIID